MKRRSVLLLACTVVMLAIAAPGFQKKPGLLLLDWAAQAPAEPTPIAILIELGLKDDKPTVWSGRATVKGARVVHREGHRFVESDKLIEPAGWEASSRRPTTTPSKTPAVLRFYKHVTVGVVLHLADVQADAVLSLSVKDRDSAKAVMPLREVLSGQTTLLWDGAASVRLVSRTASFPTDKTEDDFPAAAYGPDGTLWVAYIGYSLKSEHRERVLWPEVKDKPADFKSYYTPEFGDQLFVRYYRSGTWSEPLAITGPREDLVRCAIAVAGDGTAWVVYSANRQGNFDLYGRPISTKFNSAKDAAALPLPGPEQRLTRNPAPDLSPVMCTDQAGRIWLACQSWTEAGDARVAVFQLQGNTWKEGAVLPDQKRGENRWTVALAASPDGKLAVANDMYRDGDYDVQVSVIEGARVTQYTVAGSPKFEARLSLAYDARGRLWIAYEEGPEKWGKDYGALDTKDGKPLYSSHTVRVACLDGDKLMQPVVDLPNPVSDPGKLLGDGINFVQYEYAHRYSHPRIGLDGKGRLWLTYRQKIGTPFGTFPGSTWLTFARRLDGDHWSVPIEIHHSDGLLDDRPVLLPHAGGGLLVIHNTDGRHATPDAIKNRLSVSIVGLPGEPVEPKLVERQAGNKDGKQADEERAAVRRIRDYRVEAAGKKYHLLRGEFHRHTEISFDGGSDGSLEDMFRYAIDAAGMDWIGNGDHDSGAGREYTWWLIQKLTDAYHVNNVFTPMFTYERSVAYPHGHRNCMFAQRGVRVLPRLAEPDESKRVATVHADDTKMLYRYLEEMDGICAVHTSATSMGTDWRDNDPRVEPIVEIYQGDRNSYEIEAAPRAGYDPQSDKKPANIAGWYPKGYINNAFQKGYRLGFQSSSDHHSTHISYCIALAETTDRKGILTALKKRHCYGATDDIVLDVRSGDHLMGDEFKTSAAPTLALSVIGTKELARIEILKDSEVVETIKPGKREYTGSWTDPKPTTGVHYYYVRVLQVDDELAWSSPMWIDFAR